MIKNPTGYFIQRQFAEMKNISHAAVTACLCLLQNLFVEEEKTISPPGYFFQRIVDFKQVICR